MHPLKYAEYKQRKSIACLRVFIKGCFLTKYLAYIIVNLVTF